MLSHDEFMQHMERLYGYYEYACTKHTTFPTDFRICYGSDTETEIIGGLKFLQKLNDLAEPHGNQEFMNVLMEEYYEACLAANKPDAIIELYHVMSVVFRAIETLEGDATWIPLSFKSASERLEQLSHSYTTP